MDLTLLLDRYGDGAVLAAGGAVVGFAFGAFAARSQFCFRGSVVEVARRQIGPRTAVWLTAFAVAIAATQAAILAGWLDASQSRQVSGRSSLSGAIIGGAMFGAGMILARGCASRILILSATGNLRSLVTGLILTIVGQASLRGVLSPIREALASLWIIDNGSSAGLLSPAGLGRGAGLVFGLAALLAAVGVARKCRVSAANLVMATGVGLTITAGWTVTYTLSLVSFDASKIGSITLIGPSADTLMGLINSRHIALSFDIGVIPGIFAGSLLIAWLTGTFRWQSFEGGTSMIRYIIGAVLMGFGGMLAGGCAVGAGMSGTAVFSITAWSALLSMAASAALTDQLIDNVPSSIAKPKLGTPA